MNGVQMMLLIGASMLLSIHIINVNRASLYSDDQMSQAEYTMAATSLGQSLMHEIASKSFDESTIADPFAEVTTFTAAGSLGPTGGESYPNFNDVDDYNGFKTVLSSPRTGAFDVACRVQYVNAQFPDIPVSTATRTKRITMVLTSSRMIDPVVLTYFSSH